MTRVEAYCLISGWMEVYYRYEKVNLTGRWKIVDTDGSKSLYVESDRGWHHEHDVRIITETINECSGG